MKRIFIDTNILLDVVLHRDKFVAESARIWNECESKQMTGLISAISLNNIHYIARKQISSADALECVRRLHHHTGQTALHVRLSSHPDSDRIFGNQGHRRGKLSRSNRHQPTQKVGVCKAPTNAICRVLPMRPRIGKLPQVASNRLCKPLNGKK